MENRSTIEQHLAWIKSICKAMKLVHRHMQLGDLIGFAAIGFLDAEQKYDPSRNIKFKTYAEHRIRGAIRDGIRQWCGNGRQKTRPEVHRLGFIEVSGGINPPIPDDVFDRILSEYEGPPKRHRSK